MKINKEKMCRGQGTSNHIKPADKSEAISRGGANKRRQNKSEILQEEEEEKS